MEEHGRWGQSPDSVLCAALNIPKGKADSNGGPRADSGITGAKRLYRKQTLKRAHSGFATNRLECRLNQGVLDLTFASGHNRRFTLPLRNDKNRIRRVLYEAKVWALEHGASEGQVNAIRKALTDNGYHLRTTS